MVSTITQKTFLIILSLIITNANPCFVWDPFSCQWKFVCSPIISTTTTKKTLETTTRILTTTTKKFQETITTTFIKPSSTIQTTTKIPINIAAICETITSVVISGMVPIYKYYDFWLDYCRKQC
uniref:Uncharacterized protein n=1 Tax=Strongyloides venezuelensis TaxID=75913 RepID=A0A0K0FIF1_STRVS